MPHFSQSRVPRFRVGDVFVREDGRSFFQLNCLIAAQTPEAALIRAKAQGIPCPVVDNKPFQEYSNGRK